MFSFYCLGSVAGVVFKAGSPLVCFPLREKKKKGIKTASRVLMELEGDFFGFSRPIGVDGVRGRLFHLARSFDVCFISASSNTQASLSTTEVETLAGNLACSQKA